MATKYYLRALILNVTLLGFWLGANRRSLYWRIGLKWKIRARYRIFTEIYCSIKYDFYEKLYCNIYCVFAYADREFAADVFKRWKNQKIKKKNLVPQKKVLGVASNVIKQKKRRKLFIKEKKRTHINVNECLNVKTYCVRVTGWVCSVAQEVYTLIRAVLFDKPRYKSRETLSGDNAIVNTDTVRSDTANKWDEIYDSVLITDKSTLVTMDWPWHVHYILWCELMRLELLITLSWRTLMSF